MTAVKKSLDRALSGVEFRPEDRRRVREAVGKGDVKMRRKMSGALVFALIAALILAGVAVAAVITRGFGWYAARNDNPVEKYRLDQLEQRAENVESGQDVIMDNEAKDKLHFELLQGYYDGNHVNVTYSMDAPGRSWDATWRPTADELAKMEKQDGYDITDGDSFTGLREAIKRDFAQTGACGARVHGYFIGDVVWFQDGQHIVWDTSEEEWKDNTLTGYRNYEKLPGQAQNQTSIQITFQIYSYDNYYYKDATGIYTSEQVRQKVKLAPITLTRGKGSTRTYHGTADFEQYATWVEAEVSPVDVKAQVWIRLPDAWVTPDSWTHSEDLKGVDYVAGYHLIADGAVLEGSKTSEGSGTDAIEGEGFSGEKARFPDVFASVDPAELYETEYEFRGVPEGAKELRLRPVYSISGERPAEDVVLALTEAD